MLYKINSPFLLLGLLPSRNGHPDSSTFLILGLLPSSNSNPNYIPTYGGTSALKLWYNGLIHFPTFGTTTSRNGVPGLSIYLSYFWDSYPKGMVYRIIRLVIPVSMSVNDVQSWHIIDSWEAPHINWWNFQLWHITLSELWEAPHIN